MKKILIAEDEKPYSKALVLKLQHNGYEASSVENGEEAIAALNRDKFDLLLLDLIMPKMDGFAVLEAIKTQGLNVPVIVLSNLSQADDEKRVRELGAKEFLGKSSVSIAEVINLVNSILK
ncbi:MAG: response regulator [Candidatus Falkowbacteria bacterium]|nr:response regulator [Candidatus Falkowbacteria bacterium]